MIFLFIIIKIILMLTLERLTMNFSIVFQGMQSYSRGRLLVLDKSLLLMPIVRDRSAFRDCPLLLQAASKSAASPVWVCEAIFVVLLRACAVRCAREAVSVEKEL